MKLVATNDVHYHVPERRALHDVVTAIRLKCTVEELGFRRFASAERHLKPADGDGRGCSASIRMRSSASARSSIAAISRLDQLRYQYPVKYEGGETPMQKLERLTWKGAAAAIPPAYPGQGRHDPEKEFDLIRSKKSRRTS